MDGWQLDAFTGGERSGNRQVVRGVAALDQKRGGRQALMIIGYVGIHTFEG